MFPNPGINAGLFHKNTTQKQDSGIIISTDIIIIINNKNLNSFKYLLYPVNYVEIKSRFIFQFK